MKRVLSIGIIILLALSIFLNTTSAALPETNSPNASSYLSNYMAVASVGDTPGSVDVTFLVGAAKLTITQIGVTKISVCRYDGTPMKTIYGSFTNGLLSSGVTDYGYTYTIDGLEAGTSYYAQVTVIAADSSGSDTRLVTTNTVKAAS